MNGTIDEFRGILEQSSHYLILQDSVRLHGRSFPTWRPSHRVGEAEGTVWVVRGEGSPVNTDHIGVVWGKQLRALDFLRKPQKWLREQGDQTTSSWLGVGGCGSFDFNTRG